jgi:hypothetical protein
MLASLRGDDGGPSLVIVVDVVVEDARKRPITDLKPTELEVVQDAERQKVASFKAQAVPGHYEITYAPLSGKIGSVTIRVLRPGSHVRGPQGDFLKPRIIRPPTALEAELERVLAARGEASDLRCLAAVFQFEPRTDGIHQAIAVEVPSSELRFTEDRGQLHGHLQILVRLKDETGRVVERLTLDRPVQTAAVARVGSSAFGRLVWTGHVHLQAGSYTAETLVFEPGSGRATTRRLSFQAIASRALQLSSVSLLQPREFLHLAEPAPDDPFVVAGTPVMPTLDLVVAAGADAQVRFFVTIYPDPKSVEAPTLLLELRRRDEVVGSVPLKLPPPESDQIRYVGLMPTRSFRPGVYVLRLVSQQASAAVSADASFTVARAEALAP